MSVSIEIGMSELPEPDVMQCRTTQASHALCFAVQVGITNRPASLRSKQMGHSFIGRVDEHRLMGS